MDLTARIVPRTVYFGDCLAWMQLWKSELVDLIYLDPPFNSKRNYNLLFTNETGGSGDRDAAYRAFEDTWLWDSLAVERVERISNDEFHPARAVIDGMQRILGETGMLSYVSYMADRLVLCAKMLRPSGSIYLHCDPTASHYLKLVMDAVFGSTNFLNEIVWYYKNASRGKRRFAKAHDVILAYSKGSNWTFNREDILVPYESGMTAWRYGKSGREAPKGKTPDDVYIFPALNANDKKERLGYPTQKPVALLEWIIRAASRPGDLVLDPFCGCGTTLEAAHKLGRKWAGIDISPFAVEYVIQARLRGVAGQVSIGGIPQDMRGAELMAKNNAFDFERWAVAQIPGLAPNNRQIADGGVDGRGRFLNAAEGFSSNLVLAQVKSGGYNLGHVRDFCQVLEDKGAVAGVFITMRPNWSSQMRAQAEKLGSFRVTGGATDFKRLQFWSIEDHLERHRPPHLPELRNPMSQVKPQPGYLYQVGRV